MAKQSSKIDKEFKLSAWAIHNKTTIYVMIIIILFSGLSAYNDMPRESFPEIKDTKIYISTIYPGNTAEDIEKLLTQNKKSKTKLILNLQEKTGLHLTEQKLNQMYLN